MKTSTPSGPTRPKDRNPYVWEIRGTLAFAPLVLGLETWRRWGELLSPAALDDFVVFGSALFVVGKLARRDRLAPLLWIFVCGGAWFLFVLSTWGSVYAFDRGDPSGVPVPVVLAFKVFALTLITIAAARAIRLGAAGIASSRA